MVAWLLTEKCEAAAPSHVASELDEARALAARLGMAGLLERIDAIASEAIASEASVPSPTRSAPSASPPAPAVPSLVLRAHGDSWLLEHDGQSYHLRSTKGVRWLARLMAEPGREHHVLDLVTEGQAVDGGDAGEVLDEQARSAYRQRLTELDEEIAEASSYNDAGRLEVLERERSILLSELSRAFGLGGRERRSGGATEKARVNVQRRLRDALKRIDAHDERLGRHIARRLRTGVYCCFEPE
jgi:hypothetical protein